MKNFTKLPNLNFTRKSHKCTWHIEVNCTCAIFLKIMDAHMQHAFVTKHIESHGRKQETRICDSVHEQQWAQARNKTVSNNAH